MPYHEFPRATLKCVSVTKSDHVACDSLIEAPRRELCAVFIDLEPLRKYVASQEISTSVSMRASKPGWSTA
jgi:hypothetical protein